MKRNGLEGVSNASVHLLASAKNYDFEKLCD